MIVHSDCKGQYENDDGDDQVRRQSSVIQKLITSSVHFCCVTMWQTLCFAIWNWTPFGNMKQEQPEKCAVARCTPNGRSLNLSIHALGWTIFFCVQNKTVILIIGYGSRSEQCKLSSTARAPWDSQPFGLVNNWVLLSSSTFVDRALKHHHRWTIDKSLILCIYRKEREQIKSNLNDVLRAQTNSTNPIHLPTNQPTNSWTEKGNIQNETNQMFAAFVVELKLSAIAERKCTWEWLIWMAARGPIIIIHERVLKYRPKQS